jgi:endo-1,3(4)-beta-glucanase
MQTINTALPSSGQLTVVPFPTGTITSASTTLSPTSISQVSSVISSVPVSGNIFVPVATGLPPAQITVRSGHPQQGAGLVGGYSQPIQTNKFYTNLLIQNQNFTCFTYPYSLHWLMGRGSFNSWGLGFSHVERSQTVFAPWNPPECEFRCTLYVDQFLTVSSRLYQSVGTGLNHHYS